MEVRAVTHVIKRIERVAGKGREGGGCWSAGEEDLEGKGSEILRKRKDLAWQGSWYLLTPSSVPGRVLDPS